MNLIAFRQRDKPNDQSTCYFDVLIVDCEVNKIIFALIRPTAGLPAPSRHL